MDTRSRSPYSPRPRSPRSSRSSRPPERSGRSTSEPRRMLHSFSYAIQGIAYAFVTQRNMKIHCVCACVALLAACLLRVNAVSWLAIVLCIALVMAAECTNTALEVLIDAVSPEYADFAKRAKDCAAAGVLWCAIASLVVAGIVFVPPLVALVGA